jgi:hypothetical protein
MNLFQDFYRAPSIPVPQDGSLGIRQQTLDGRFPAIVSQSPFRLWSPGEPIPQQGDRLLIGVATWSAEDMKLLDALSQVIHRQVPALTVELFNVADCQSPAAFQRYVPGIGSVFQTPVVGHWSEGVLVEKASGYAGRELVASICGLDDSASCGSADTSR